MTAPRIELSMIVKDGAATLARCLASVRGAVDRIVIGDTGSTDNTIAIAKEFGAEVIAVPWQGDFSAARNAVLAHAKCDWILSIDADEMLDQDGAHLLRQAIRTTSVAGFEAWRWNYVSRGDTRSGEQGALPNPGKLKESQAYPAYVRSLNTRLFRRNPEVRFERPVHETVAFSLKRLGLAVEAGSFIIHHLGHAEDSAASRGRKNELYQQIGLENLARNPSDVRTCFELGLGELEHFRRPEAALDYFLRAIQIDNRDGLSLLYAGVCLVRMRQFSEALRMLGYSAAIDAGSIVLHEAVGDAHFHLKNYPKALQSYSEAQRLGSSSALIMAKRGVCEIYTGRKNGGMRRLREALLCDPAFPELYDLVATGASLANENEYAAKVARRRLALAGATAFHFALAGVLLQLAGDPEQGKKIVAEGLTRFPNDPALFTQWQEQSVSQ